MNQYIKKAEKRKPSESKGQSHITTFFLSLKNHQYQGHKKKTKTKCLPKCWKK